MATSLKRQLLLRVLPPLLIVMLLGGGVFYFGALRFANRLLDESLHDLARSVVQQVRVIDGRLQLDLPKAASDILRWDAMDHIYFRATSARYGLIAGDDSLPVAQVSKSARPQFREGQMHGEPIRIVSVRLDGMVPDDSLVIEVAETLKRRDRIAEEALIAIVVPQFLLVLLAGALVMSGVKVALRPLGELVQAVDARRPGDLSPLSEVSAPTEVRPLTAAINALLARLNSTLSAQQRFIADAAHQLRTPLAALKVQLERALREHEPESRLAVLVQLRESLDRTVRLSNQLLLLARAEPGSDPRTRFTDVDLRALAHDIGSQWVPRALAAGADLGLEAPETPIDVRGDPLLLGELINNLIDNALKYGGKGVCVTLQIVGGRRPQLIVEDNGPGVPPTEREQIFERFHRVPGSPGSGSGLGLAIVREITQAHHATLSLETSDTGGMRVRVSFPGADSAAL